MQKGNILIFLLVGTLVLVGVVGGAFYLGRSITPKPSPTPAAISQTPQPTIAPSANPAPNGTGETANWKTYTDSKNLFSIKYPSNLYVKGGGQQFFLAKQAATSAEVNDYSDRLVEINLGNALNRFESYYNTLDHSLVKGYSDLKLRDYLIDGNKAVEYGYDEAEKEKELKQNEEAVKSGADVGRIYYNKGLIINKDRTIIEISTPFYIGDFKNTFDQILSTFKFTQ